MRAAALLLALIPAVEGALLPIYKCNATYAGLEYDIRDVKAIASAASEIIICTDDNKCVSTRANELRDNLKSGKVLTPPKGRKLDATATKKWWTSDATDADARRLSMVSTCTEPQRLHEAGSYLFKTCTTPLGQGLSLGLTTGQPDACKWMGQDASITVSVDSRFTQMIMNDVNYFEIEQPGNFRVPVPAVQGAETAEEYYDWRSWSSHTGFELAGRSSLFLYRDVRTDVSSLIWTHGMDGDDVKKQHGSNAPFGTGKGKRQGVAMVHAHISQVPGGAKLVQSDDKGDEFGWTDTLNWKKNKPSGKGGNVAGRWWFKDNSDGGALDNLPSCDKTGDEWEMKVEVKFLQGMDDWRFFSSHDSSRRLDASKPLYIRCKVAKGSSDFVTLTVHVGQRATLCTYAVDPQFPDFLNYTFKWRKGAQLLDTEYVVRPPGTVACADHIFETVGGHSLVVYLGEGQGQIRKVVGRINVIDAGFAVAPFPQCAEPLEIRDVQATADFDAACKGSYAPKQLLGCFGVTTRYGYERVLDAGGYPRSFISPGTCSSLCSKYDFFAVRGEGECWCFSSSKGMSRKEAPSDTCDCDPTTNFGQYGGDDRYGCVYRRSGVEFDTKRGDGACDKDSPSLLSNTAEVFPNQRKVEAQCTRLGCKSWSWNDRAFDTKVDKQVNTQQLPGMTCVKAAPFCLENPLKSFEVTDTGADGPPGNSYGLLDEVPSPNWFYVETISDGLFSATITGRRDVDYAVWGPFDDRDAAVANCGKLPDPLKSSYEFGDDEIVEFQAQLDKAYLIVITNYDKVNQTVNVAINAENKAKTDCTVFNPRPKPATKIAWFCGDDTYDGVTTNEDSRWMLGRPLQISQTWTDLTGKFRLDFADPPQKGVLTPHADGGNSFVFPDLERGRVMRPNLDIHLEELTMLVWVKRVKKSGREWIMGCGGSGAERGIILADDRYGGEVLAAGAGKTVTYQSTVESEVDVWMHVAVVYDFDTVTILRDGGALLGGFQFGPFEQKTEPCSPTEVGVGGTHTSAGFSANVRIGQATIIPAALSDEEVVDIYKKQRKRYGHIVDDSTTARTCHLSGNVGRSVATGETGIGVQPFPAGAGSTRYDFTETGQFVVYGKGGFNVWSKHFNCAPGGSCINAVRIGTPNGWGLEVRADDPIGGERGKIRIFNSSCGGNEGCEYVALRDSNLLSLPEVVEGVDKYTLNVDGTADLTGAGHWSCPQGMWYSVAGKILTPVAWPGKAQAGTFVYVCKNDQGNATGRSELIRAGFEQKAGMRCSDDRVKPIGDWISEKDCEGGKALQKCRETKGCEALEVSADRRCRMYSACSEIPAAGGMGTVDVATEHAGFEFTGRTVEEKSTPGGWQECKQYCESLKGKCEAWVLDAADNCKVMESIKRLKQNVNVKFSGCSQASLSTLAEICYRQKTTLWQLAPVSSVRYAMTRTDFDYVKFTGYLIDSPRRAHYSFTLPTGARVRVTQDRTYSVPLLSLRVIHFGGLQDIEGLCVPSTAGYPPCDSECDDIPAVAPVPKPVTCDKANELWAESCCEAFLHCSEKLQEICKAEHCSMGIPKDGCLDSVNFILWEQGCRPALRPRDRAPYGTDIRCKVWGPGVVSPFAYYDVVPGVSKSVNESHTLYRVAGAGDKGLSLGAYGMFYQCGSEDKYCIKQAMITTKERTNVEVRANSTELGIIRMYDSENCVKTSGCEMDASSLTLPYAFGPLKLVGFSQPRLGAAEYSFTHSTGSSFKLVQETSEDYPFINVYITHRGPLTTGVEGICTGEDPQDATCGAEKCPFDVEFEDPASTPSGSVCANQTAADECCGAYSSCSLQSREGCVAANCALGDGSGKCTASAGPALAEFDECKLPAPVPRSVKDICLVWGSTHVTPLVTAGLKPFDFRAVGDHTLYSSGPYGVHARFVGCGTGVTCIKQVLLTLPKAVVEMRYDEPELEGRGMLRILREEETVPKEVDLADVDMPYGLSSGAVLSYESNALVGKAVFFLNSRAEITVTWARGWRGAFLNVAIGHPGSTTNVEGVCTGDCSVPGQDCTAAPHFPRAFGCKKNCPFGDFGDVPDVFVPGGEECTRTSRRSEYAKEQRDAAKRGNGTAPSYLSKVDNSGKNVWIDWAKDCCKTVQSCGDKVLDWCINEHCNIGDPEDGCMADVVAEIAKSIGCDATPDPAPEPVLPKTFACKVWGDPHVIKFWDTTAKATKMVSWWEKGDHAAYTSTGAADWCTGGDAWKEWAGEYTLSFTNATKMTLTISPSGLIQSIIFPSDRPYLTILGTGVLSEVQQLSPMLTACPNYVAAEKQLDGSTCASATGVFPNVKGVRHYLVMSRKRLTNELELNVMRAKGKKGFEKVAVSGTGKKTGDTLSCASGGQCSFDKISNQGLPAPALLTFPGATRDQCERLCCSKPWCKTFDFYISSNGTGCDLRSVTSKDVGTMSVSVKGFPSDHYVRRDDDDGNAGAKVKYGVYLRNYKCSRKATCISHALLVTPTTRLEIRNEVTTDSIRIRVYNSTCTSAGGCIVAAKSLTPGTPLGDITFLRAKKGRNVANFRFPNKATVWISARTWQKKPLLDTFVTHWGELDGVGGACTGDLSPESTSCENSPSGGCPFSDPAPTADPPELDCTGSQESYAEDCCRPYKGCDDAAHDSCIMEHCGLGNPRNGCLKHVLEALSGQTNCPGFVPRETCVVWGSRRVTPLPDSNEDRYVATLKNGDTVTLYEMRGYAVHGRVSPCFQSSGGQSLCWDAVLISSPQGELAEVSSAKEGTITWDGQELDVTSALLPVEAMGISISDVFYRPLRGGYTRRAVETVFDFPGGASVTVRQGNSGTLGIKITHQGDVGVADGVCVEAGVIPCKASGTGTEKCDFGVPAPTPDDVPVCDDAKTKWSQTCCDEWKKCNDNNAKYDDCVAEHCASGDMNNGCLDDVRWALAAEGDCPAGRECTEVPVDATSSLFAEINIQRAKRGGCQLEWDDALAAAAQTAALSCSATGTPTARLAGAAEVVHQVLAKTTGKFDTAKAAKVWGSASKSWDAGERVTAKAFAQMVWKDSRKVGCAAARSPNEWGYVYTVVCRFDKTYDSTAVAKNVGTAGEMINLCECNHITSCPALQQCMADGECDPRTGVCSRPFAKDSTPCNDRDARTVNDQCVSGVCQGEDLCAGVTCTPPSQCHLEGECDPYTGQCSEVLRGQVPCDDGNKRTEGDQCNALGECVGVDICGSLVCEPPTECQIFNGCEKIPASTAPPTEPVVLWAAQCTEALCKANEKYVNKDHWGIRFSDVGDATPFIPGTQFSAVRAVEDPQSGGVTLGSTVLKKCRVKECDTQDNDVTDCYVANNWIGIISAADCESVEQGWEKDSISVMLLVTTEEHPVCTWLSEAKDKACDDGNNETMSDTCDGAGTCAGVDLCSGAKCEPDPNYPCQIDAYCNHLTGSCIVVNAGDNSACDDGRSETLGDVCLNGLCQGINLCDDPDRCRAVDDCHYDGVCDTQSGTCNYAKKGKPDGTPCDDEDPTTANSTCVESNGDVVCKAIAEEPTDPPDQCKMPLVCDNQTPPKCAPQRNRPNNTQCDDGIAETVGDRCINGECVGQARCNIANPNMTRPYIKIGHAFPSEWRVDFVITQPRSTGKGELRGEWSNVGFGFFSEWRNVFVADGQPGKVEIYRNNNGTRGQKMLEGECPLPPGPLVVTFVARGENYVDYERKQLGPDNVLCIAASYPPTPPGLAFVRLMNLMPDTEVSASCERPGDAIAWRRDGQRVLETPPPSNSSILKNKLKYTVSSAWSAFPKQTGSFEIYDGLGVQVAAWDGSANLDEGVATGFAIGLRDTKYHCPKGQQGLSVPSALKARLAYVTDAPTVRVTDGSGRGTCYAKSDCHEVGECDPQSGVCSSPFRPDNTPCLDGLGICMQGICKRLYRCANVTCTNPSPQCRTVGQCDPRTGICSPAVAKTDGRQCNDGRDNTVNDTCVNGWCIGTDLCLGKSCDYLDRTDNERQCILVGECDPATGACKEPPRKADGTACDDGSPLTGGDSCRMAGGKFQCAGDDLCKTAQACVAQSQCHNVGVCDPVLNPSGPDYCTNPQKMDGTKCDDGDADTLNDTCTLGQCRGVTCNISIVSSEGPCASSAALLNDSFTLYGFTASGDLFVSGGCGGTFTIDQTGETISCRSNKKRSRTCSLSSPVPVCSPVGPAIWRVGDGPVPVTSWTTVGDGSCGDSSGQALAWTKVSGVKTVEACLVIAERYLTAVAGVEFNAGKKECTLLSAPGESPLSRTGARCQGDFELVQGIPCESEGCTSTASCRAGWVLTTCKAIGPALGATVDEDKNCVVTSLDDDKVVAEAGCLKSGTAQTAASGLKGKVTPFNVISTTHGKALNSAYWNIQLENTPDVPVGSIWSFGDGPTNCRSVGCTSTDKTVCDLHTKWNFATFDCGSQTGKTVTYDSEIRRVTTAGAVPLDTVADPPGDSDWSPDYPSELVATCPTGQWVTDCVCAARRECPDCGCGGAAFTNFAPSGATGGSLPTECRLNTRGARIVAICTSCPAEQPPWGSCPGSGCDTTPTGKPPIANKVRAVAAGTTCFAPEDRCTAVDCVDPQNECLDSPTCVNGRCESAPKPVGTHCTAPNNAVGRWECDGSSECKFKPPSGCFVATKWTPSQECGVMKGSCLALGNGIWETREECCRPGNAHTLGCRAAPPKPKPCWIASKWWPNRECALRETKCEQDAQWGSVVFLNKEDCCAQGRAHPLGCSSPPKTCFRPAPTTDPLRRECVHDALSCGSNTGGAKYDTEEECCRKAFSEGCTLGCASVDVVLLVDGSGSMRNRFGNYYHGYKGVLSMLRTWIGKLPLTGESSSATATRQEAVTFSAPGHSSPFVAKDRWAVQFRSRSVALEWAPGTSFTAQISSPASTQWVLHERSYCRAKAVSPWYSTGSFKVVQMKNPAEDTAEGCANQVRDDSRCSTTFTHYDEKAGGKGKCFCVEKGSSCEKASNSKATVYTVASSMKTVLSRRCSGRHYQTFTTMKDCIKHCKATSTCDACSFGSSGGWGSRSSTIRAHSSCLEHPGQSSQYIVRKSTPQENLKSIVGCSIDPDCTAANPADCAEAQWRGIVSVSGCRGTFNNATTNSGTVTSPMSLRQINAGGVRAGIVQFSRNGNGARITPKGTGSGGMLTGSAKELLGDVDWHESNFINHATYVVPGMNLAAGLLSNAPARHGAEVECAKVFGQCGGQGWQGLTCCEGSCNCQGNSYFKQCMPPAANRFKPDSQKCGAGQGKSDRSKVVIVITDGQIQDSSRNVKAAFDKVKGMGAQIFGAVIRKTASQTINAQAASRLKPYMSAPVPDHFFNVPIDEIPDKLLNGICDSNSAWGAQIHRASDGIFYPNTEARPFYDFTDCTDPKWGGGSCDCNTEIQSAWVSIGEDGLDPASDTLACSACSSMGLSSEYRQTIGVLILRGKKPVKTFLNAIESVAFRTTAFDGQSRHFTFSLGDGLVSPHTGSFYRYIPQANTSWSDAQAYCEAQNLLGMKGYLLTIGSKEEQDVAEAKIGGQGWLGLSDRANKGAWRWVAGPTGCPPNPSCTKDKDGSAQQVAGAVFANWEDATVGTSGSTEAGANYGHIDLPHGTWTALPADASTEGFTCEWGGLGGGSCLAAVSRQSTRLFVFGQQPAGATSKAPPSRIAPKTLEEQCRCPQSSPAPDDWYCAKKGTGKTAEQCTKMTAEGTGCDTGNGWYLCGKPGERKPDSAAACGCISYINGLDQNTARTLSVLCSKQRAGGAVCSRLLDNGKCPDQYFKCSARKEFATTVIPNKDHDPQKNMTKFLDGYEKELKKLYGGNTKIKSVCTTLNGVRTCKAVTDNNGTRKMGTLEDDHHTHEVHRRHFTPLQVQEGEVKTDVSYEIQGSTEEVNDAVARANAQQQKCASVGEAGITCNQQSTVVQTSSSAEQVLPVPGTISGAGDGEETPSTNDKDNNEDEGSDVAAIVIPSVLGGCLLTALFGFFVLRKKRAAFGEESDAQSRFALELDGLKSEGPSPAPYNSTPKEQKSLLGGPPSLGSPTMGLSTSSSPGRLNKQPDLVL
eukprot:Hpha_TRINITY_DN15188_c1_g7::TRINITY_DN15188_c1_g7_i1::g.128523::m.128523